MAEITKIIVTRPRGSWKWQAAYAISTYTSEGPGQPWKFLHRGPKFARTQATADLFAQYPQGRRALESVR
jgi:hypothetical protein